MARAFIRFAAVATCLALSLTAEDRQARSGDLDRGPPFGLAADQWGNFKERISYVDNVGETIQRKAVINGFDQFFEDYVHHKKNNYIPRLGNPQQNIAVQEEIPRKDENGSYLVPEVPLKELREGGHKSEINSNKGYAMTRHWLNQGSDSTLNNADNFNAYKNKRELKTVSTEEDASRNNILAGSNNFNHFSNLRFKFPFRVNSSILPLSDELVSSLELKNRQMRSKAIDKFKTETPLKEGPSEISFEITDEEAMALKRRVELSTEFFLIPSSSTSSSSTSGVLITKTVHPDDADKMGGIFRNEVWVVPVIALSAVTMILIAGFEVFVLCKAWRTTPSRRHLFLGQMLLLGLFSCAGLASVVAASPTEFTCALIRFGTGVAYAIVFASLLVKCVFLISLNGGVYLPAPYQGLLLLFAVLIQVAIGVQWLLTSPPLVDSITVEQIVHQNRNRLLVTAADISTTQVISLCRTSYVDMVLSLIYVIFLIVFVTVLAVKSRGIRDNYREATYIGLSVGCSIPTWLIWIVGGLIINERHKDACIAFGLVIISIMVFLIMFMPKGRQLAAMGKEGVYVEDREERFSSLSRAGSGYSPSFFHFKPIKYGINNGTKPQHITTLGAGTGGGGVGGGGDLALYPSPPSYTRFYQYYSSPPGYYSTRYLPGGLYLRPDDGNLYTTLEPTLSSNPNVYFQRGNGLHPGMMY